MGKHQGTGEDRPRRVTSRVVRWRSRTAASVLLMLAGCGEPPAPGPTPAQRAAMLSAGRAVASVLEGATSAKWGDQVPAADLVALRDIGSPSLALRIDAAMSSLAAARAASELAALQGRSSDGASVLREKLRLAGGLRSALDAGKVAEVVAISEAMMAPTPPADGR